MSDISDKVAYSVTFSRRILVEDDLHPEFVTQSTSFFEYRPEEEPFWAATKNRMLAKLNASLQSTYVNLDTAYQTFLRRGAWHTYEEKYYTQEEVDKMLQGYQTGICDKRSMGFLNAEDTILDFNFDED